MTAVIYTETDCPSRDLLYPYKDEMVEHYFNDTLDEGGSSLYTNEVIEKDIIPRIHKTVANAFRMKVEKINSYIYVQNNEKFSPIFHHHIHCLPNILTASLTATLYLDPPQKGGEFQFLPSLFHHETYDEDLKGYTFKVEENKLYFFPSWWMHRPLPQEDETYRVCISFEILSFDRPLFTHENVVW